MNSLDFLKQAQLADNLGYFRLADQLYKKASRTVKASAFDKALFEALEKAGIKAGERASYEAVERALGDAVMTVIKTGESLEFRLLAKEAGLNDVAINELMENAYMDKKFNPTTLKRIANILEVKLNSEESIFNRMLKDTPPIETPPSKTPIDKIKEVGKNVKDKINNFMKQPGAVKKLKGFGILAVGSIAAGWYFVKVNGEPASDEEVANALSGSEMYDLRMEAGQQQTQNEKAQAYVDANKDKFTSQRDFYNAALSAGDKNFANSVIAIVKKDLSLPIESEKTVNKDSESYLNKSPYGTS